MKVKWVKVWEPSQPVQSRQHSAARTAYWIMGYLYNLVALALYCVAVALCCHFPTTYSASAFMAQLWLNDRLVCICLCMRACGHHERANWEQSPIQLLRFRHRHSFSQGAIQWLRGHNFASLFWPPTYLKLDNSYLKRWQKSTFFYHLPKEI